MPRRARRLINHCDAGACREAIEWYFSTPPSAGARRSRDEHSHLGLGLCGVTIDAVLALSPGPQLRPQQAEVPRDPGQLPALGCAVALHALGDLLKDFERRPVGFKRPALDCSGY